MATPQVNISAIFLGMVTSGIAAAAGAAVAQAVVPSLFDPITEALTRSLSSPGS
jgi:hypothetical protein